MSTAKASLKNLRISARKVRLVADLIRGKRVQDARNILTFNDKKASEPIRKLLDSAVANAESAAAETQARIDTDAWVVGMIQVNEGRTLYRFQPAARGRAAKIRKRSSHIDLVLLGKE